MVEAGDPGVELDEDGLPKRTGTWLSASAHIITVVIGSGVLSLGWAIAQLGWIAGPAALLVFAFIIWFTSMLLVECNKSPDPITGKRNYCYMDVIKANLGGVKVKVCGIAQYVVLVAATIGYTVTAGISMVTVGNTSCLHRYGHDAGCHRSNTPYMIIFGCIELILSQIPNFHQLSFLSTLAAIMSFAYSFIAVALSITKVAEGGNHVETSLGGVRVGIDVTLEEKVWQLLVALGNIAFAYGFSIVLDTIKSGPSKIKEMKKATSVAISVTTIFYVLCGVTGYAAFGNKISGNLLTGFELDRLFWLANVANVCVVVHLIGAYQILAQPVFQFVEKKCAEKWPESGFIKATYQIPIPMSGNYDVNLFRVVWRSIYVIIASLVAIILPFFNDLLGLIGAAVFWPLTVFLPVEMYIKHKKIPRFSFTCFCYEALSLFCLIITLVAAAASVRGLIVSVKGS
ncbi:Amino acid transporter, transmembrane domain [Dillenia turbinata]|uniref:Amino acid transporter, transmembrane domain n=1 Tax=Dillenia turbinata TaxID=194707 RepID=A0AAN8UQW7_9MAGN